MPEINLVEIYNNIPEINLNSVEMLEANSTIKIFEGNYILKHDKNEIMLSGSIYFYWLPISGTHFYGTTSSGTNDLIKIFAENNSCSIIIDSSEFGQGFITKISITGSQVKGRLSQKAVLGDRNIPVNKIHFSIPNLREFHGFPVKSKINETTKISMNRLLLDDEDFVISIDKCQDFDERQKSLNEKGGYIILYAGELTFKKKKVTHAKATEIIQRLNAFLTFMNGRRTSAIFIKGIHGHEVIWSDFTDYFVDPYKTVYSWPQRDSIEGINELWKNFKSIWLGKDGKDFLITLIHWYVEANSNAGFSEGSIIMAQTALELIYNWWIIEQKKMIIGKDSENISASNKIRLLLTQLNIDFEIPNGFNNLNNFLNNNKIIDAPEAAVYIRNAIVHSQHEKRKKLSQIDFRVKHEALQLYIWYIEISLLRILDFNGKYFNRSSKEIFSVNAEEYVPWNKKETLM
jgi:hypothetical protein